MAIKLQCPCGKALSVKDEYAGRQVKCPACQAPIRIPQPMIKEESIRDDWDLGESDAEDIDDDQPKMRPKSRGGKSLPVSDTSSRLRSVKAKGRKSKQSNRGLIMGLSVGGGLAVMALLAWMLWPAPPGLNVVADPDPNTAGSASTTGGDSTSSTNTANVEPSTQSSAGPPNPLPPTAATATKLEGDLNFLQGTWKVTDIEMPPDAPPAAAEMFAQMKLFTFTIKDDKLSLATPAGVRYQTIKLDSLQTPKRIDLTPLETSSQNRTQLSIYSIEGETWRVCSTTQGGLDRPQEMKAAPGQTVMTFERSTESPAAPASSFDIKAWLATKSKLKAMKVSADLAPADEVMSFGEGVSHCVALSPPETADGTMSPELWTIVSSMSHIFVRPMYTTDATLQQLAQHPGLVGLNISGRLMVTAKGIGELKTCPTMTTLFIGEVPVSPELCDAISQLPRLRRLGINGTPVSSEMLSSIMRLNELEYLSLQEAGIADDDLLQIQKLTKLRRLFLDKSKVTDQGLHALKSLTQLQSLFLNDTQVTDQGLQTLKSFSSLTLLSLRGLNVTPQAVAELEAALPNCKVVK